MANAGYFPAPERRRQILAGAKKVFATRGYHDTNISHICEDLGIARGTLYQYFDSKKAVFVAIVEALLERVRAAVDTEPRVEIPPGARLTADQIVLYYAGSLRRVLGAVFEDEASLQIVVREAVGLDVQVDSILRAIDDIVVDRFASDLAAAQRAGILRREVNPRLAALFAVGGIQKLALDALAGPGRAMDLDALSLEASRMHMIGLIADSTPSATLGHGHGAGEASPASTRRAAKEAPQHTKVKK
jgi:AcrR family transcriptional regulator